MLNRPCRSIFGACVSPFPFPLRSARLPSVSRAFSSTAPAAMAALQRTAFFDAIDRHDANAPAVIHSLSGRSFMYGSILSDVAAAKQNLLQVTGKTEQNLVGERIAFLVENAYDYVGAQLPDARVSLCHLLGADVMAVSHSPGLSCRQRHSCPPRPVIPPVRTSVYH